MSKRAIILAGGKGSRLMPYTVVLPKPLMPIGEYPILEVIVKQLVYFGYDHITMAVNHQAQLIKAFFGDGSNWKVKIDYSIEEKPLGTMGPINLIKDLPNHFLILNGDVLTDLDFGLFFDEHVNKNSLFTISSYKREQLIDFGVLETKDGELINFVEKPTESFYVSMGIYMVSKEITKLIPKTGVYGFDSLMIDSLMQNKKIQTKEFSGFWLDIGRPDDYMKAIDEFSKMRKGLLHE